MKIHYLTVRLLKMDHSLYRKFTDFFKDEIQKKFGKKIAYDKDCRLLSEQIYKTVKRHISTSTLKRFWGIIDYPFTPSAYTLDTLAAYIGHESWVDYLQSINKKDNLFPSLAPWEQLRKRMQILTDLSLQSMKEGSLFQIRNFPVREFAARKFEEFMNSAKIATAFIAPSGYGKTTTIIQLAKQYFLEPLALFPNDILCLVDGKILSSLILQNLDIAWLKNLEEFIPERSFSVYFRQNPDQVKGRIVLIIDAVNEIYPQQERRIEFIGNLMKIITSFEGISWYKVIITCRPETWKYFILSFRKNPVLKQFWFDVSFYWDYERGINVPLLEENEIRYILEKNIFPQSLEDLQFHKSEILNVIKHPYFLDLFFLKQEHGEIFSDTDLLYHFSEQIILKSEIPEEKYRILDSFFKLCDMGRKGNYVKKGNIDYNENITGYHELISDGILHEYNIPGSYLNVETYVKFSHNILFEFFLANKWIEKNELDIGLCKKIIENYKDEIRLQCNILIWLVKIMFREENTKCLKGLFSIFENFIITDENSLADHPVIELANIIGMQLRNNKYLRKILIPEYAKSEIGRLLYFEKFTDFDCIVLHSGNSIDHYLEYNQTGGGYIYGNFLKFMQYYLSEDLPKCREIYEKMHKFELTADIKPLHIGYYFGIQIIYRSAILKDPDKNLFEKIFRVSDEIYNKGEKDGNSLPQFEFAVIFALNYGDNFEEIIKLGELISKRDFPANFRSNWKYQLCTAFLARAYLNTREIQKGSYLFRQVETISNIPVNLKHYVKIRHNNVKAEFLIFNRKFDEAKEIIKEIKTISHMLRFRYYLNKAKVLENRIRHYERSLKRMQMTG